MNFDLLLPFFQGTPPGIVGPESSGTYRFFFWYFYGLGGVGGWLIFLLLALAALLWLNYDSQKRRLPATGWKLAVVVLSLLLLPTILYRFTVTAVHTELYRIIRTLGPLCDVAALIRQFPGFAANTCQALLASLPPLTPYGEYVFYLGLLGGVLAPIVAAGYYITFQGQIGCYKGHVYDAMLSRCPYCAAEEPPRMPSYIPSPAQAYAGGGAAPGAPSTARPHVPKPEKPKVSNAWLVDLSNGHRHDLCQGNTRIGRSPENDIILGDQSVSRLHAQIREMKGICTLSDLNSKSGTLLNGKPVRHPQVLENGDKITLGDTVLQFVSAQ